MKNSKQLAPISPAMAPVNASPVRVNAQTGYVSFGGLGSLLWSRKWTGMGGLALGLGLGLIAALVQQPVYRAMTTIEVQIPNDDYLNRRQLEPSLLPGVLNLEPFLQTEMKRLTSDTMLWRVFEDLHLAAHAEFLPKPAKPALGRGAILENLHQRLVVRLSGQTQVVEVTFEANDPALAARFANALVENYRSDSIGRRESTAGKAAELMSGQLAQVKTSLTNAQARLQAFVRRKGVMSGLDREGLAEARLRQVQVAHVAAQEARMIEQARLDAASAAAPVGALDSDTLSKYRVQLTELERKKAEAAEVLEPAHYKVRQIQAEIDAVQQASDIERKNLLRRMKDSVAAAASRERSLERDFASQAELAVDQVTAEVDFTSLKHDVEGFQQMYDGLQQKVREAGMAAGVPANSVNVLDPADTPFRPVRPKKSLLVAIGGFFGLLAGFLLVFFQASAPAVDSLALPGTAMVGRLATIPRYEGALLSQGGGAIAERGFEFAASFRQLRASIFAAHANLWPRTLVITSLEPGRGRTTVATNLAITLANEGHYVLLVDADGMKPRLQMQLGLRGGRVLEAAPGGRAARTPLRPLCSVWTTEVPGLSLARFGRDDDMRGLHELEAEFDAVIVDAPTFSQWPEALAKSRFADGLVLVAGDDDLLPARLTRLLRESRVPVLGWVSNHAPMAQAELAESPRQQALA